MSDLKDFLLFLDTDTGNISFTGSTISSPSNADITLSPSGTGDVRINTDKISLGNQAGETAQGDWGIAVGYQAGRDTQGNYGVAIGREAGEVTQGTESIAIGRQAGYDQGNYAVHIGSFAGGGTSGTSGVGSIGLGKGAGTNNAGQYAIAIGYDSQYDGSANNSIAIGKEASKAGGGSDSIAIGYNAMLSNGSAAYTTAIGYEAARSNSVGGGSDRAIAIGYRAGYATLHPNSIILNAENAILNSAGTDRFYVAPIRNTTGTTILQYNSSTKEITHNTLTPSLIEDLSHQVDDNATNLGAIDTGLSLSTVPRILLKLSDTKTSTQTTLYLRLPDGFEGQEIWLQYNSSQSTSAGNTHTISIYDSTDTTLITNITKPSSPPTIPRQLFYMSNKWHLIAIPS
jgi:hypothetical protein